MKNRSSLWVIMIVLVFLAFTLRLHRLDHQSLRGDESFTVWFSAHSYGWLLPNIAYVEPNPPLYYFLLHNWMQALGQSEFVTRFVSLLFGVLSVALIYLLGISLGHSTVGALSAFLMAINPYQIWHAQDVRNYTLWPALSMAGLVFLLHALRKGKVLYWAGYVVMTLLSLYTHYYELFILIFQNLFVLVALFIVRELRSSRRVLLVKWLVAQLVLVVTYGPWLLYGSSRLLYYTTRGESPALWTVFSRCLTAFSLGETIPPTLTAASAPLLYLLLLVGLGYALKKDRHLALLLILYLVVPSLCMFFVAQVRPLFRERYLNVIAPAYYLTFSYALVAMRDELPRWRRVPLIAGVAFFALSGAYSLHNYLYDPMYQKSPNWRALADCMQAETGHTDVIILNYPDTSFSYYYHGPSPTHVLPRGPLTEDTKLETAMTLKVLSQRYDRIWFYPFPDIGLDSEGFVETWLNRHGRLIEERIIFDFRWLIYEPILPCLDDVQHPLTYRLGETIWLRGYEIAIDGHEEREIVLAQPGDVLPLSLYWEATDRVEESLTVFVHLIDARHHVWAQKDSLPQLGDFPTDEWMPGDIILDRYSIGVPSHIPPGGYLLVAGMYDPISGQRLPVFDDQGASQGDQTIIAQVQIK